MDLESAFKTTILEALIDKVTSIQNKDTNMAAINAFTKIVAQESESIPNAVRLITCRMQSPNEWEALQTLYLLEACMDSGIVAFQSEIGKFRFLNELIKLVSPKYLGSTTPIAVKNKIISLLRLWCLKYPKENKIKEAFDMLNKQGVLIESNKYEPINNSSSSSMLHNSNLNSYADEKSRMLQKLLRSNKPNDLKAANHLIKTMVKEKQENDDMRLISNNAKLLAEMLVNITSNSPKQDIELIKELKETCVRMKPTLTYLITCCDKTTKDSAKLFELNDFLNETLQQYHDVMLSLRKKDSDNAEESISHKILFSPPALLDFSSPLDDISMILPTQYDENKVENNGKSKTESRETMPIKNTVETLEEIFNSSICIADDYKVKKSEQLVTSQDKSSHSIELFEDLDALGKSLLKSSIYTSKNEISRTTFNNMAIESFGECSPETSISVKDDDELLSISSEIIINGVTDNISLNGASDICLENSTEVVKELQLEKPISPLLDISVPFIDIKTEIDEKIVALEDANGINVCIQLTQNRPRQDVSVFLVLSSSKRNESISNFLFQPVVPKDCRLKLQSPFKFELPPFNPYIPIETIVQIMLIASTNKEYIPLKFVVSYSVKEEMITEMGEIAALPLR